MKPHLHQIPPPDQSQLGDSAEHWLDSLPGACWMLIPGKDRSRCRALSTLLHGNEPSGLRALWRWLGRNETPHTDLLLIIPSVDAARQLPRYSQRQRAQGRDMNRCFAAPFDLLEGQLAEQILSLLQQMQPEAMVDLHNTSGRGPAFGVSVHAQAAHQALVKLFCDYLILVEVYLGALMEVEIGEMPVVTIECGGSHDPLADEIAFNGIELFAHLHDLFEPETPPRVLRHPLRVELDENCWIAYGHEMRRGIDLLLSPDVDQLNFGRLNEGHDLGQLGPKGLSVFKLKSGNGPVPVELLFREERGRVVVNHAFFPFMITTRSDIAHSDCLLYAVPESPT